MYWKIYENDKSNLLVIDKLCLVLLKAYDKNDALNWLNQRKCELSSTLPYTPEAIADIESVHGKLQAELVVMLLLICTFVAWNV
jgi:hypothetical protein